MINERVEYFELFYEPVESDEPECSCGIQGYYHCTCRMNETELNYYTEWRSI